MGKVVPFRKAPRSSRWIRVEAYAPAGRRRSRKPGGRGRLFPVLLVALPLAAFTAVLLLPHGGGVEQAGGARPSASRESPRSAAALDAEQPEIAHSAPAAAMPPAAPAAGADRESARFALCSGPVRVTCVVDGDTIWYRGEKIRIADLDTPEVSKPGCAREAALGRKATLRLQALLNAGPFTLEPNASGPGVDKYGRSLKLVTRGGESLGMVLVREGLAEQWGGPRKAWCGA